MRGERKEEEKRENNGRNEYGVKTRGGKRKVRKDEARSRSREEEGEKSMKASRIREKIGGRGENKERELEERGVGEDNDGKRKMIGKQQ